MSVSRQGMVAVAVFTLLLVFVPMHATAEGASIAVVAERAEDIDGDGTYEYLALDLSVTVSDEGQYSVLASIKNSGGVKAVANAHLLAGENNITLRFNGDDIYYRHLSGKFTVNIMLTAGADLVAETTYTTREYSADYFNPDNPPEGEVEKDLTLHLGENSVLMEGSTFTTSVKTDRPEVIYYYTGSDDLVFSVLFTDIVFYDDSNGNGAYDAGEEVAAGNLSQGRWAVSINLLEGYSRFDFSVVGTLEMGEGSVELVFHYSSAMRTVDGYGRQKFDIDIKPEGVSAERIALIQRVTAISGTVDMVEDHSKDAYNVYMENDRGERIGYYSFSTSASLYSPYEVDAKDVNVSGYRLSEGVYAIDYPYQPGMYIHHDPEVGLDMQFFPHAVSTAVEAIRNNPALFAVSIVLTALLVSWNLASVKKKRYG